MMLKKVFYFGSNEKSIPLLSLPGCLPTRKYAHQKTAFSEYKLWVYLGEFHYITF